MDIETLFWVRQRDNHALLRQIDTKQDRQIANQEKAIELLGQILILLATTNRTQASPPSSPSPTGSPPQTRWRSLLEPAMQKFGREAITSIALWIGSKIAGSYIVPAALFVGGLVWAWIRG
jgi:uncharacterized membrane protein YccC